MPHWLFQDVPTLKDVLYYEKLPSYDTVEAVFKAYKNVIFLFAHENRIYQFWNKEYIECLANEIKKRVGNKLVLEVAAGDGMLSYWLRSYGVNIIATDSGEWKITPRNHVEIIDAVSAIKKYNPIMVIASWLPYQEELDIQIFNQKVPYIILIGEENGACGSEKFWETEYWKKAGYERVWLDECDRYNICRTDYCFGDTCYFIHSTTGLYILKHKYA